MCVYLCAGVCIREMLNVLMNVVKNIYSICVMACDAIKFIPTRTSRVMASRGGVEGGEGKAGEGPARNRLCVCVGCLEKHFQARPKAARAAKRDSSESQVPRANGKRGELAG